MDGSVVFFYLATDIFWMLGLMYTFLIAHLGYLASKSTPSRCCNPRFSCWGLEQTALALCVRVLNTLYLSAQLWWISHRRYWSVCVDFLYTPVDKVLFSSGVTVVSRKDIMALGLGSSRVNWMAGSTELMWCKNSLCICCCTTKASSTYLFQILGELSTVFMALYLKPSIKSLLY